MHWKQFRSVGQIGRMNINAIALKSSFYKNSGIGVVGCEWEIIIFLWPRNQAYLRDRKIEKDENEI